MNTLTVKELKGVLDTLPEDCKVFLSTDEEGNNYHGIDKQSSFSLYEKDKALIVYPGGQWFDIEEIAPSVMEDM